MHISTGQTPRNHAAVIEIVIHWKCLNALLNKDVWEVGKISVGSFVVQDVGKENNVNGEAEDAKPLEFLVQQLEKLKTARDTKKDYPSLFDESNLDAVFGILDPTKQGHVTLRQYREALKTLGIKDFEMDPKGAEDDKITLETFKREAKVGLMNTCATFKTV
ncbi:hypothetical protein chiPu_0013088 [Chiloscyllium punctatum]|uniref:EF-hand domain-containing protein n=1 Tax=Chiloscyllium punctatum TaxID=137246 RepID=A0A401SW51_CHIPU|nr:hypothetical protein [Chiloscyllium punctatum]